MKFNVQVEVDDFLEVSDIEDDIRSVVIAKISDEIIQSLRGSQLFKGIRDWDAQFLISEAIDKRVQKARPEIEERVVAALEKKMLATNAKVKEAVSLKEFTVLSNENLKYIEELIEKAIARKFK